MPVYEKHGRVGAKGFLGPGRRHEKAGDNRFRVGTPTKLGLRAGKGRVSGGGNIYVGAGGGWHFRSLSADLYRGVGDPLYGRPEDVMYGAGSGMHYTAAALMLRRNPKPAVRGRLYAVGIGDAPAMAVPHTTA